ATDQLPNVFTSALRPVVRPRIPWVTRPGRHGFRTPLSGPSLQVVGSGGVCGGNHPCGPVHRARCHDEEAGVPRPSLDVRRAGLDDVDELLVLWVEAREENASGFRSVLAGDPVVLRHRLSEALTGTEVQILLATWERRPAGFVLARCAPVSPLSDANALHIDQLYVTRELRRH